MPTPAARLRRLAVPLALAVALAAAAAGCRPAAPAGSYAAEAGSRLKAAGFDAWFPPDEGVEAGQIWSVDLGGTRSLAYGRPAALELPEPKPEPSLSGLRNLTLSADEGLTLADGVAGADAAGAAGSDNPLRAALAAAGVDSARVDFGQAFVRDLSPAGFDRPEVTASLSAPYREAVAAARSGSPRHVGIAGVVEVAGLTCTWDVGSSDRVAADLPRLRAALAAKGELSVPDRRTVRLVVPATRPLVVGVRRLVGGAGFAAPAPAAAVVHNLDHLATFAAAAGVQLGSDGGGRRAGLADRAAFERWLGRFRPQPGVDERVADLLAAVRAAPDAADPGPPPQTYPGTVRLSHRDVTTLLEAQRVIAEEAVRRGLASADEVRQKAQVGN